MFLRETLCLFCLHPSGARLGLDKKNRPFLHCTVCGTRSFVPLADVGLRGLAIVPTLVEAWRRGTTEEVWRGQVAMFLNELRLRARGTASAPTVTAEAALTTALEKIA